MRVKWIDGVKGIAILMVIVIHLSQTLAMPRWLNQSCSFGALGVQLFFMMSAYCCCLTWNPERFNSSYWWHKYKRLAPWYVGGIILYAAYWWLTNASEQLANYKPLNILANLLFINGFLPPAQNSIVPGGWSISCIALFVFAFPFLMRMSTKRQAVVLAALSLGGGGVSLIGYKLFGWTRFYAYCVPINQVFPFAAGLFLWYKHEWLKAKLGTKWLAVLFAAFLSLTIASVLFTREYAIFYRQILVSCAFVFGLPLLAQYERFIPEWLVWLGRHSYEIFILHFAALWLIFR